MQCELCSKKYSKGCISCDEFKCITCLDSFLENGICVKECANKYYANENTM